MFLLEMYNYLDLYSTASFPAIKKQPFTLQSDYNLLRGERKNILKAGFFKFFISQ